MLFCFHCRHSNPPGAAHCANCGRSLARLATDDEDEGSVREALEPAPETSGPRHTIAYEQLQQICAASVQNLLAADDFRDLLDELVAYLDGQHARFTRLEVPDGGDLEQALTSMLGGLAGMREACQAALALEPPLTEAAAAEILSLAVDADTRIGEASDLLDRLDEPPE